ncbi:OLC1v1014818C2 [Oldenlandia corymbosa var. corymbosa]|uniref:OLC1v1014818C2 n=1 Tax=Oldenlandia corymbosa var. corymbosa TaxID=529605 RepID=A0AAV1E4A9_OLDCO|nr:OLC1v1014818C2 [Oldenlandia corymbosa var. corymbosa]
MMAGNPNWWSMMNGMHPQPHHHQQLIPSANTNNNSSANNTSYNQFSSTPPPLLPPGQYNLFGGSSSLDHHPNQDFPRSWSQLLLGGLGANNNEGHDSRFVGSSPFHHQNKKLENWEDLQILSPSLKVSVGGGGSNDHVKQEVAQTNLIYGSKASSADEEFQAAASKPPPAWSQVVPASSPTSCVTSLSSNLLNFSASSKPEARNQHQEASSECNSSTTGSVHKKPRIQHSSAQPALKVRKEKLGDRITALHQLVSPFGKTDTASVLSEAIGYIRFLQAQIEALSLPYMGNVAGGSMGQPHQQQHSDVQDLPRDLRSRGLCLVPISCTQHVGNETGADYWAPALGGGF